ncbi:MAG TPA: AmmeMemoRadiSam system protein B [Phycisphaerae bacterium]|nr:AmmeMemoRadiSam system protein B [Phycisphaerae bacterium]HNU43889.1 AmmeMemoRadiSam system protein B [Phycisphaerae bacterium]
MISDPSWKPQLRPLEAFPVDGDDEAHIGLRDGSGLSPVVLSVSQPAALVIALMDGTRTCAQICRTFELASGQALAPGALDSLLEHLDQAHFLEGPSFEAFYRDLLAEYRRGPTRPMPHAAALGIEDDSGSLFRDLLAGIPVRSLPGVVRGLIAPHLDYPRGSACYAAAYATLRDRPAPERIVILGTNHFGRGSFVVATAQSFSTPLGTTETDAAFVEQLEARCGNLRESELDHAREHSIELQVAWLQYVFGAGKFKIVPMLCPDPCLPAPDAGADDGHAGVAGAESLAVRLKQFAAALRDLMSGDDRDTLLVAGADFSHVGPEFGDAHHIDDALLEEVRRRDHRAIEALEANDPETFLARVAADENPTRVCSAGCMYVLAHALPGCLGTLLGYHQAVDDARQCGVTCAAVAFT